MAIFNHNFSKKKNGTPTPAASRNSLRTRLLKTLIPLAIIIIMATGLITYVFSTIFLESAQDRALTVTARGMARELEGTLESARRSLLYAASGPLDEAVMRDFLKRSNHSGRIPFREFALISPDPGQSIFLVTSGNTVFRIGMPELPSSEMLFRHNDDTVAMRPGDATLTGIEKAEHLLPLDNTMRNKVFSRVIRLYSPSLEHEGSYVMVSIDAISLRNALSRANSSRPTLWSPATNTDARFSFLFDLGGWILFQSNAPGEPDEPLMTSLARASLEGTLGRPGHPSAFQPAAKANVFWEMVSDVKQGSYGVSGGAGESAPGLQATPHHSMAYCPVTFRYRRDEPPGIYGGLAFVDYSSLSLPAGYRQVDVIFVISLVATALLSLATFLVSRTLTQPLRQLAQRVDTLRNSDRLAPIDIHLKDSETRAVAEAINSLIETVQHQMDEIRDKDEAILMASLKERSTLDEMLSALPPDSLSHVIPEISGSGTRIEELKSGILKAAGVSVDVLIEGETGTGKQLTAEAIHRHSERSGGPFISINCGELDENLLLDSLFGHVKGAFTEARHDRKGAFVEADGGTLFLDEIQSASPKVQQALLRALAMRVIRPLGSDQELKVDVRIIAASNLNLKKLSEDGKFRSDLYYRLRVLMIRTPPLRSHRENIPRLARHFLNQAETLAGRGKVDLSKGALERLLEYDWPGNVRELQNCMIMTATMCDRDVIQAADLLLEGTPQQFRHASAAPMSMENGHGSADDASEGGTPAPRRSPLGDAPAKAERTLPSSVAPEHRSPAAPGQPDAQSASGPRPEIPSVEVSDGTTVPGLNARQALAWPHILREGGTSRSRYEELINADVSSRTAINDLQDLVVRGLLEKIGHGPATRYVTARNSGS